MTNKLEEYREEIVSLNYQILELLSKKRRVSSKIGEEKLNKELKYMILNVKKK